METYSKTLNAHNSKQWFSDKLTYIPHHFVNFWDIWFFFQNDRWSILYKKMHSTHLWPKVFCVWFHQDATQIFPLGWDHFCWICLLQFSAISVRFIANHLHYIHIWHCPLNTTNYYCTFVDAFWHGLTSISSYRMTFTF